jgi:hypothetical protein
MAAKETANKAINNEVRVTISGLTLTCGCDSCPALDMLNAPSITMLSYCAAVNQDRINPSLSSSQGFLTLAESNRLHTLEPSFWKKQQLSIY